MLSFTNLSSEVKVNHLRTSQNSKSKKFFLGKKFFFYHKKELINKNHYMVIQHLYNYTLTFFTFPRNTYRTDKTTVLKKNKSFERTSTNQPHASQRVQTPIRIRDRPTTRLIVNPRLNLNLHHWKHFWHVSFFLIKNDIVHVFSYFTHNFNPYCSPKIVKILVIYTFNCWLEL